jgi:hypothetical protein
VSFALVYNANVLRAIKAVDPLIQEQILDEIDAIADGTVPLPSARARGDARGVHDFILAVPGGSLYVFVTIWPQPAANRLRIVGFGTHFKPSP